MSLDSRRLADRKRLLCHKLCGHEFLFFLGARGVTWITFRRRVRSPQHVRSRPCDPTEIDPRLDRELLGALGHRVTWLSASPRRRSSLERPNWVGLVEEVAADDPPQAFHRRPARVGGLVFYQCR